MKFKYIIIGIMMVLMLCISPVVAVDFYMVDVDKDEDGVIQSYTYRNILNKSEEYIKISSKGTTILCSLVTFEPVNVPYTPRMVVHTTDCYDIKVNSPVYIYLPKSVDEWEIKYYSHHRSFYTQEPKYLKNAGTINLNEYFGEYIWDGLYLELGVDQKIFPLDSPEPCWSIPDV